MLIDPEYVLRLYVADEAPNALRARSNLRAFCRVHLNDRHQIEVIDVFKHPDRALEERIFMTPTLIKQLPLPVRRIVGSLSDTDALRFALGLDSDVDGTD